MRALLLLSRVIDAINGAIGRWVSWLLLAAVLISAGNAIIRKMFDMSSNAFLELQWYLFGTVFMLASAYTLLKNEHIRIDILSNNWSRRTRNWIDLVLHIIFLVPFSFLMAWLAWPWFWNSYNIGEISSSAGGLIVWPAKAAVLVGFLLLSAQAVSEIIKRAAVLAGVLDEDAADKSAAETAGQ
ncbi:TRAP transporter small permease subunit [Ciceribacter sp. L1K23]|uniref:TRAP transporter small permease subunit n=1 Tax=unclassified Ciceribacter TaxID=2628820 RepID=UPI001ABDB4F7|nr:MULTISPECIES: TRAP transporter small permease subunit [unclassified Ciceribacter]MBO3762028.1 TRAP transporter small permease subunit [Ciceribacter sp. L1K22]MBR0558124.1 TRAP transporter small permease subunit [Ciceribacter sp. L1K23]